MVPERAPPSARDPYGEGWWPVVRAGWRDRLSGDRGRANARHGFLRPPSSPGKVAWIRAGSSAESLRLGAELAAALRDRRLDLRIAFTYEHAPGGVAAERIQGLRRFGHGYAPSDREAAVRRVLSRLRPFALVWAGAPIRRQLLRAASAERDGQGRGLHLVALGADPCPDPAVATDAIEAVYPVDAEQAQRWRAHGYSGAIAEPADPFARFVEAQVEPTLVSLLTGPRSERMLAWWWHGGDPARRQAAVTAFLGSPLAARGVLLMSPEAPGAHQAVSTWQREPLPAGTVLSVDEPRWYAAVAGAAAAGHLDSATRLVAWQALAGGMPLSAEPSALARLPVLEPLCEPIAPVAAVLEQWAQWSASAFEARVRADACRRRLYDERRRAEQVHQAMLQRMFDW